MRLLGIILLTTIFMYSCDSDHKKTAHKEETKKEVTAPKDYGALGVEYAMAAQKVLGQNLMGAMKKGGPVNALSFCNVKAAHLTDSMSVVQNVKLKRVTDKTRNPKNQANKVELDYIQKYKNAIRNQGSLDPIVDLKGEKAMVYFPIATAGLCLKCHGAPGDNINEATFIKIKELYPDDVAIGYEPAQIRGLWVIEMDK